MKSKTRPHYSNFNTHVGLKSRAPHRKPMGISEPWYNTALPYIASALDFITYKLKS
ncbi:hypothetical protein MTR_4g084730 [Medicago truncatula]|uniref:Uncharacterized protein n=1 Tax=Medicago truncatula TaxID=3880 RepID=A0A072UM91_MEDTR|nr:hypothetical protein MTR_4g084730 [Medicago truncatula]